MKRFIGLSLALFLAGLALVLYAVFFGPRDFKQSVEDHKYPVGEIQYNQAPGSPQQPWAQSGATLPSASQPDAKNGQHNSQQTNH